MFDEKGQILIDKEQFEDEVGGSADDLMMTALDAGAEDFNEYEDYFEVLTDPESFSEVRESLEKENIPMMEADIAMIPQTKTALTDETDIANMRKILDLLDESDDVQNVYTNLDGDLDD
jgi:transcriptional/translational regulatory protein YebC/TACO1